MIPEIFKIKSLNPNQLIILEDGTYLDPEVIEIMDDFLDIYLIEAKPPLEIMDLNGVECSLFIRADNKEGYFFIPFGNVKKVQIFECECGSIYDLEIKERIEFEC